MTLFQTLTLTLALTLTLTLTIRLGFSRGTLAESSYVGSEESLGPEDTGCTAISVDLPSRPAVAPPRCANTRNTTIAVDLPSMPAVAPPSDAGRQPARRRSSRRDVAEASHMLLYLNEATFVGEEGEVLAEEVRSALASRFPVVMVHENDKSAGGCEFAHFFVTTPQDLIADGLYNALAHAWHPEPFRAVSVALVAQAFGAEEPLSTQSIGRWIWRWTGRRGAARLAAEQDARLDAVCMSSTPAVAPPPALETRDSTIAVGLSSTPAVAPPPAVNPRNTTIAVDLPSTPAVVPPPARHSTAVTVELSDTAVAPPSDPPGAEAGAEAGAGAEATSEAATPARPARTQQQRMASLTPLQRQYNWMMRSEDDADDVEEGAQTLEVSARVRREHVGLETTVEEEERATWSRDPHGAPPAEVTHTARLVKSSRGFGIKVDGQNKVTLTLNPKP